ncbi:hypothetical protein [Myxococcus sp. CA040A]|uniref:hypothetical protein n=1 Tax=Myxococcus sp. CA040A TaxID=2741738 RepID=UPI00157A64C5|nr:hypothetical protein [Myxococcus sp. CA040A]NTX08248.1 hypothetical protein [Myxococcus sp. CA040A]
MQAGKYVSGALLAVGLMLAGCGGPTVEDTEAPDLTSREALVPDCTGSTAGTIYYSNAAHTAMVGYMGCGCGRWTRWGQTSSYSSATDLCPKEYPPEV